MYCDEAYLAVCDHESYNFLITVLSNHELSINIDDHFRHTLVPTLRLMVEIYPALTWWRRQKAPLACV